jgi:hypothetical protein
MLPLKIVPSYLRPSAQAQTINRWSIAAKAICSVFQKTTSCDIQATASMTTAPNCTCQPHGMAYLLHTLLVTPIALRYVKMVNWEAFHEYIMPSVQGCPVSQVNSALRSACIEFCEKTNIWKQDSAPSDVVKGWSKYTFAPPSNAKVCTVSRLEVLDSEVQPTTYDYLELYRPDWRKEESSTPSTYFFETDDTIQLVGTPTEDIPNGLRAVVSLKPTRTALGCPTFLYTDWAETLAAGTLMRLCAIQGKAWSKPDMVSYYTKLFRDGISRARSKSAKSWQKTSLEMFQPSFYSAPPSGVFHNNYN